MTVDEAKALVKSRLSEKRYKHTINVKKMAVKLAKRWGADPEKAAMAAILHDSAKELPKQELLQIFADNAIIAENEMLEGEHYDKNIVYMPRQDLPGMMKNLKSSHKPRF